MSELINTSGIKMTTTGIPEGYTTKKYIPISLEPISLEDTMATQNEEIEKTYIKLIKLLLQRAKVLQDKIEEECKK